MTRGPANRGLPTDLKRRIDAVCDDFENAWKRKAAPRIEDYLDKVVPDGRPHLLAQLLRLEIELRDAAGESLVADSYKRRFPEHVPTINTVFASFVQTGLMDDFQGESAEYAQPGRDDHQQLEEPRVERIGKYAVKRKLGKGAFGIAYLAWHPQLHRDVALKVLRPECFHSKVDVDRFLEEARNAARIKQPRIVAVYDVDLDADRPFIVQEYIEGGNLKQALNRRSYSAPEAAALIAEIAAAIAHAHQLGVYHRDLKPANILLDTEGHAHVADFGLALHETVRRRRKGERSGTPPYMSPEQVRAESHRLDGRSDIWSLGVILYELLVGQRPFQGDQLDELFDEIRHNDPRPPRQVKPQLAPELERICLKCLSKQMTHRYTTANDLADDLRAWLARDATSPSGEPPSRQRHLVKVVPKGLRAFEDEDADFFLELLPGPRDRDGLSEVLRFWKTKIERTDADRSFTVGLIYGPSGSGKSSMIRAGLLPRLSDHVLPIYVEATPDETELRLLKELRKQCPAIPREIALPALLARLREGDWIPEQRKVLIIFDQFEQWLHATKAQETSQLVDGLRQCDGSRLQSLVLVRDDFWMSATRFLQSLEVELLQGHNVAAVDRFDLRHAKKVLTLFGQAYGALPDSLADITGDQQEFLDQSLRALADDGRVVCVRLALFAEMVKGKSWTPATLQAAGGAEGIGVTFLDETFSAPRANPKHRLHARAAQDVLQELLPPAGIDIKGNMRSYTELLRASRYSARTTDFPELIAALDGELRLITPTDPLGDQRETSESLQLTRRYYQLTHDYLVPALRNWITRKQRETWHGRASLRLEELAHQWARQRDRRFLPSPWEYLLITLAHPRRLRDPKQHHLMAAAAKRHIARCALAVAAIILISVVGLAIRARFVENKVAAELETLFNVKPAAVPFCIARLRSHRQVAVRHLDAESRHHEDQRRLRAAIALAGLGHPNVRAIVEGIRSAPDQECENIVSALRGSASAPQLLWESTEQESDPRLRMRYASVLLHLGDTRGATLVLQYSTDDRYRTEFIHRYASWRGDAAEIPRLLETTEDPAFQSGVCLALGRIEKTSIPKSSRLSCERAISGLYRNSRHAGTHGAAEWALRQWGIRLDTTISPEGIERQWWRNSKNMTMVRVPPGTVLLGAGTELSDRPVGPKRVVVEQGFWICDREITLDLFRQFSDDPNTPSDEQPSGWSADDSLAGDCPVQMVSLVDVILFCNWLSRQEERAPCYRHTRPELPMNESTAQDAWQVVAGADGYRLSKYAEWEHAVRAGTETAFHFGDLSQMDRLGEYAWFANNSWDSDGQRPRPCGRKMPNALGLFDMLGNVRNLLGPPLS